MNITLRSIQPTDYKALITLFKEFALFEKLPEKMINSVEQMMDESEYVKGFVALSESNEIIGYATYFFAYYTWIGKSMYMDDLYVKQNYRGNGIGTTLINAVIEQAKTENCKKLRWQVSEWNQPAIDFYNSLGAEISTIESNCDLKL